MAKMCPLLTSGIYANSDATITWHDDAGECKEAECAQWLDGMKCCAIPGIVTMLEQVSNKLLASR